MRVASRYNPDQHQFERHTLKGVSLKVILPASDATTLNGTMAAIFSTGIDPALERSMPSEWRHYFLPGSEWQGGDSLAGVAILPAGVKPPEGTVLPEAEKKPEPGYTDQARMDRVKGTVDLRLVVDADGVPRRITIRQPLGYGLDASTAEAVARWRFRPGSVNGKPAAIEVLINQGFDLVTPPG
jgi:TonB family protein